MWVTPGADTGGVKRGTKPFPEQPGGTFPSAGRVALASRAERTLKPSRTPFILNLNWIKSVAGLGLPALIGLVGDVEMANDATAGIPPASS